MSPSRHSTQLGVDIDCTWALRYHARMKSSDAVGLSCFVIALIALEAVARNMRPQWWGAWLAVSWAVALIAIIAGRHWKDM